MTNQLKLKLDAIIKVIDTATMGKVFGNRERHNVDARQIYFKIVHDHLRVPISHSAHYINKNHATGIHALKQFKNFFEIDKELRRKYHNVIDLLEDFDFNVERTDNKDLLEDYLSLIKKNNELEEKYDSLCKDFETEVHSALMCELDNLPVSTLRMLNENESVTDRLRKSLTQTLLNRRHSLNSKLA
tara:strand:+ start:2596 stop:3156 length:561 start_codon:yes stop_codon:yes gene_type:complete